MNGLLGTKLYGAVPILMYHQVTVTDPEEDALRLAVPPDRFEAQMKYLSMHGFATITLDEAIVRANSREKPGGRRIVITFDDGYLDNYTHAFPILEKYGFSATIFLVSDLVGKMRNWGLGGSVRLMDWSHVREMSRYGNCFQNHTVTHPDLTTLADERMSEEFLRSRKKIEDALGIPVQHLAYPYGKYNKRVIQMVEKTGHVAAYGIGPAVDKLDGGRFCKERFPIYPRDRNLRFRLKTCAWSTLIRRIWNVRPQF